jgi:hypothetical protein
MVPQQKLSVPTNAISVRGNLKISEVAVTILHDSRSQETRTTL